MTEESIEREGKSSRSQNANITRIQEETQETVVEDNPGISRRRALKRIATVGTVIAGSTIIAANPAAAAPILCNTRRTGTLTSGDPVLPGGAFQGQQFSGGVFDTWDFNIPGPSNAVIDAEMATGFIGGGANLGEGYLLLEDLGTGDLVAQDAGGGVANNARLSESLGSGNYRLYASSPTPNQFFPYSLTLTCQPFVFAFRLGGEIILPNSRRTGTLENSDATNPPGIGGNRRFDTWTFTLSDNGPISAEMVGGFIPGSTQQGDSYLILQRPNGAILEQRNGGGVAHNARLNAVLPAGEYNLIATSANVSELFPYALTLLAPNE